MIAKTQAATLDDLYHVEGKAELVAGRIVHYMASGHLPSKIALRIAFLLDQYAAQHGGEAYGDGICFAMRPPLSSGRESFSPDASYYVGPLPTNKMRFIDGAPLLAVEVRSEDDYSPAAELEMAAKRADYFEAGTKVVWDVDPVAQTIVSYAADSPGSSTRFTLGEAAHAEAAIPGLRVPLDEIFHPAKL
jgi:Uma2 family endonuclease